MNDVRFDCQHHLGIITLARPQALNALNLPMIQAMQQQLLHWEQDDSIYAVVIQAEPGKAFCAGGDVRWLYETGLKNKAEQMQFFWHEYRLNHFIHQFQKPYIALLNGITMGGGVGVSLHGAYAIANEQFIFAMPETGLGLFPDIGASYLLAHCPGQIGLYLALTGNRLNAKEANKAGLINYLVTNEQFEQLLGGLYELDLSQDADERIKAFLSQVTKQEQSVFPDVEKINHYFSKPSVQAIMEALKASDDAWALATLQTLEQKSPLSLAVTFEQIHKAQTLSMAECIKMDYRLVAHFMNDHDFYEGVRALLIDKDKNPRWSPASLDAVTPGLVANYFEHRGDDELALLR
ncbi:enoyl-CoA hydratase/carnithine racemase [Legionella beliardensis]|uniref:3-hydroxyisobutyryl-CoA hydrolase n=1 Tax=Legionella beliardensis TaxID=91822 RepID=A0A378I0Z0_9GAMM|nr:enoyl-CoA hydratase/isomerase family protein [Legionella beliardensis]STX28401.1 enoyl-CoA hydratase/carnithine racemase [Legionella beliardensis]